MKTIVKTLLILSLLATHFLNAQQPTPARLEGMVVRLNSADPLSKVRVELLTAATGVNTGIATTTTDEGKFIFPNVKPGEYRLLASRQAYIRAEYGQRTPEGPGVTLALSSGQVMRDIRIVMMPGGVISGRVLDRGKPTGITEAPLVFAVRVGYELGQRVLTNVLSGRTNDLGEYHIFWLPPGRYYVVANINDAPGSQGATAPTLTSTGTYSPNNGVYGGARRILATAIGNRNIDTEMHVPMFYPGTPDLRNAQLIDVSPGAEVRGIDIQANPVPALHIRGSISGMPPPAPGNPLAQSPNILLYPMNPSVPSAVSLNGPVIGIQPDANGFFDKDMVSPGTYMLFAIGPNRRARVPIEVRDSDVNGVNVVLAPPATVSAHIIIDGANSNGAARPEDVRITLMTDPVVGGFRERNPNIGALSTAGSPSNEGDLNINVSPGKYRVFVRPFSNPARGWTDPPATAAPNDNPPQQGPIPWLQNAYVKSIRLGDRDVLRDGLIVAEQNREKLVITIGTNVGIIEGQVLDAEKKPVAAASVALIPDNSMQFIENHKVAITTINGRFQLKGIAPGDYKLFAWESAPNGAWQDPEFVGKYESLARHIHVDEGTKLDLEVNSIPE